MPVTAERIPARDDGPAADARHALIGVGINHALHDGYADLIYVLLPVWQQEFGLGYASLALLRTLYSGTLAALQLPSTRLAGALGVRAVLLLGTLSSAAGYVLAGASGGIAGLCVGLALSGAGSSTQHPLASAVIARAYGRNARVTLGTYNFAGDVGKATVPPLIGLLLTVASWRHALWLVAALGLGAAFALARLLPSDDRSSPTPLGASQLPAPAADRRKNDKLGFALLVTIGMLDNAARPAFLLYLPFLLQSKGASLTTVGLALSLVFIGGAFGKAVCGRLGERLGVTRTVLLTEIGTALAILAVIGVALAPALLMLPLLGIMLNGTSSVLYGTVPEMAPDGRIEHAFAVFYTFTLGGSALAAPLLYGRLGDMVGPSLAALASAATALSVVPLMLMLSPRLGANSARARA